MRGIGESTRLRLLLVLMGVLQAVFFVLRVRPYGASEHTLLAVVLALTALATVVTAFLPERLWERLSSALDAASATRARALLVLLGAMVVAGLAGVLTQQPFSWDEGPVLWSAEVVASGGPRELFARYRESYWLGPQHPPLVPLLYGAVTALAGSHLKLLRVVDLAFGCGTVLVAFAIAERLYERRTALAAGLLLLASPLFQRIATAATNDMPLTFLFCLALLLGLRLLRDDDARTALLLGLVTGCGLLVKYTMVLVLPVLLALVWCLAEGARTGRPAALDDTAAPPGTTAGALVLLRDAAAGTVLRRHGPVVLAIAGAMLLAWLDHAWSLGILDAQGARLGRLASVTQRSPRWALDALLFKLPAAIGVAWLPWIALGGVAMWYRRAMQDRFVGCWVALVFVPLALTLPDNRYFLPAFPALAIVAAQALVARPRAGARVLLLALALCAITVGFYTQIDLGQRAGVFGPPPGAAGKR